MQKNTTKTNSMISWMVANPVTANLLMFVFLIGGLLSAKNMKVEVFPEFTLDFVSVSVSYPGASPEELEKGVVLPIEEAIQGIDSIKEITSTASEGMGIVTVEMINGENLQKLSDDIKNEVDRIRSFPEDAEDPNVTTLSHKRDVITMAIYGDLPVKVLYELAEKFRDQLIQSKDVSLVEITGVPGKEISIEISRDTLRKHNLTISEITRRIKSASIELPGGSIKTKKGEILIRVTDRKDYGKEFEKIPIITETNGTPITLGEIALIKDGMEDTDFLTMYNGKPSITLDIYRIGKQTPIQIAKVTKQHIASFKESLPEGISLAILKNQSTILEQRMNLLLRNGALGWILVIVLLTIFLEFKLAFWVAMGVPISFLGAFLFLPMFNISINMISLFAFIISLGIVVDDAIVIGENIFSHYQKGDTFFKAAINGTKEVAMPVTFSVLTNMAAFLPLAFVPGIMGKFFRNIPIVVISVFFISLIESIFILPAHLAHDGGANKLLQVVGWFHNKQQNFSIWFKNKVSIFFGKYLKIILYHRYLCVAISLSILILTVSFIASGRIGMTTFMKIESTYAKATVTLPYGSSMKNTKKVVNYLIQTAEEIVKENGGDKLSKGIGSNIGIGRGLNGSHMADIRIFLTDPEIRHLSTEQVTNLWRKRSGKIAGIDKIIFESDAGGPGSGGALTVELSHRNINVLDQASQDLAAHLKEYPNVTDIDSGYSKGKEQFDFKIKPEGVILGITSQDIARQLRDSFYGHEVVRQLRGKNEVKIMVRLPENERESEYYLENFLIKTPMGKDVLLGEIAHIVKGRAFKSIKRKDLRRIQNVGCDVIPRSKAGLVKHDLIKDFLPKLKTKYQGLTFDFSGKQHDMKESNKALGTGMLFALLVIYAMLAIPFKSYIQPLIIMISIPFGIVGAVLGHVIMGYPLSILSMFGIVALSGVVVNDSLVLIELANRKYREGMSLMDAIIFSAINRFRPIMLTTMTTFGGLAPMIFETSRQAKFLIPMAISLGYGILFATTITLMIVPSLYLITGDFEKMFKKILK